MSNDKASEVLRFSYEGKDKMVLPASAEAFEQLKTWLISVLEQLHVLPRDGKQFIIAADEIFSNIVNYAYTPEDDPKTIEVTLSFDWVKLLLSMAFADRGIAFNPLDKSAELPKTRIQNRVPGGIGLFLVHQFMDELTYRRDGKKNILTISKILHPQPTE